MIKHAQIYGIYSVTHVPTSIMAWLIRVILYCLTATVIWLHRGAIYIPIAWNGLIAMHSIFYSDYFSCWQLYMQLFVWALVVMKPEYYEEFILDNIYFARVFHIIHRYNSLYVLTHEISMLYNMFCNVPGQRLSNKRVEAFNIPVWLGLYYTCWCNQTAEYAG